MESIVASSLRHSCRSKRARLSETVQARRVFSPVALK